MEHQCYNCDKNPYSKECLRVKRRPYIKCLGTIGGATMDEDNSIEGIFTSYKEGEMGKTGNKRPDIIQIKSDEDFIQIRSWDFPDEVKVLKPNNVRVVIKVDKKVTGSAGRTYVQYFFKELVKTTDLKTPEPIGVPADKIQPAPVRKSQNEEYISEMVTKMYTWYAECLREIMEINKEADFDPPTEVVPSQVATLFIQRCKLESMRL